MRLQRFSLGAKLGLSLLAFLLLLAAATSAAILYGFSRTQNSARDTSRGGLEDFGSSVVGSFSRLVADTMSLQFSKAGESATAGATYMAAFKGHGVSAWDPTRLVPGHDGIRYDPAPDRLADAWVPNFLADDPGVDGRLRDASALDPLFGALLQKVPSGVAMYFIGTGGEGRYYPPNGVQDVVPPDFDLWTVPGFDAVRPDKNPERNVVWTSPYEDSAGQGLIVSAIAPVYFNDEFVGVVAIDISLDGFIAQIDDIGPSPHGYSFYLDRGGNLLATERSGDVAAALDAPDHEVLLGAMDRMRGGEAGTTRTTIGGDEVVVGYSPLTGIGGSLALVTPVEDIREAASASDVTDAIGHEGNVTLRITLATVAGMFVLALGGATYLNRWLLVSPLRKLATASRQVAGGDLTASVAVERRDELGELAADFNVMVEQLRESERMLEQRVEDRTRELTTLLEVVRNVGSTLELQPLLQLILEQLGAIAPYDRSLIMIREGDDLRVLAMRARPGFEMEASQMEVRARVAEGGLIWELIERGEAAIVEDTRGDTLLAAAWRKNNARALDMALQRVGSWMAVPIRLSDRTIGMLVASKEQPGFFTQQHAELATALGTHAGVAINNAELFEQAQHAASLEERQRLARELHDSVSQALYGIALGAETARIRLAENPAAAVEPVDYVMSLAQAGLAEMRALIFELRPESLESEGLVAAIEKQGASLSARHNIAFDLEAGAEPDATLPVKEALYRIGQEALHNVVKHAGAASVRVRLESGAGSVTLTVRDDGKGFDPTGAFPGHVGLESMRERAEKLGGTLTIESAPGRGTTVVARLPV